MPIPPPFLVAAIPKAVEVGAWIYEHGFKKRVEGAPDAQYANFGREVRSFNGTLERVQNALTRAIDCRVHWPSSPLPEDDIDLAPLVNLVGDYETTLSICKRFLEKNAAFERDGAGVVKRIRWSALLAEDLAELRNRISFHNVRLSAVLKPIELTLYTRLREDIQGLQLGMHAGFTEIIRRLDRMEGARLGIILQESEQANQDVSETLPQVPAFLRGCFAQAAQSQAVRVNDQIRLSSLIGHFANGTSKLRAGTVEDPVTPDPFQFVSLWKAVWIVQQWTAAPMPNNFHRTDLTASLIQEHERLLLAQMRRFKPESNDLLEPQDQDIETLPPAEFLIWLFEPSKPRQELVDSNPGEFRVFESALVDLSDTEVQNVVLYASHSRKNVLRVVIASTSKFGNGDKNQQEFDVDLAEATLFPTYAQPNATVFNLQLKRSRQSTSDKFFSFRSLPELHAFQQCFTSFYVQLDLPGLMAVTIKKGGFISGMSRSQALANYGRAQIWTHELSEQPQTAPASSSRLAPPSQRSRNLSASAQSGTLLASQTSSSRSASRTLVNWTSIHAPSVVWREDHTELPFPEPPMLVLLIGEIRPGSDDTVIDAFRLLSVPLDGSVIVDQGRCACRNQDDVCNKVILTGRGRSTLKARLFDYGTDVMGMNLAALRSPVRHQDLEQKFYMKKIDDLGRIAVQFTHVKDKKDFRERLASVSDNYIALWQDYRAHRLHVAGTDHVDRTES